MKSIMPPLLMLIMITLMTSCQDEERETIATRIQYDVNIVSPDPAYDWWIQNLPGPQRERLVSLIIDGAVNGTFRAHDYFNNPITPMEVRRILSDTSCEISMPSYCFSNVLTSAIRLLSSKFR